MPTDVNLLKDRNMKNRKTRLWVLIVLLNMGMGISTFAQKIPLVYTVENTGIKNPAPVLPGINELPVVKTLTDPFQWSDGSGRSTNFKDWSRRRAEIAREIEHYEIGEKPVVSKKDITANIVDDTLRVNVTVNGQTLTLKAKITYPAGKGPFPAIIGIGRGTGSLPPPAPKPFDLLEIVDETDPLPDDLDIIDADDESNNKESFDLNNLNYDEEYDTDEVIAFVPSEDMPVFPENIQKWLSKHVKYPQIALENGVQGKVFVQFVVEKDGSVSNIKVVRGVDASLDKEAVRVVSVMPKWKPGKQRGKAVRVAYTLPIAFQIGSY